MLFLFKIIYQFKGEAPQSINDFCWITSTFSLPDHANGQIGKSFAYPGVSGHKENEAKRYHSYYQWVCIMLFIQGEFKFSSTFIHIQTQSHTFKHQNVIRIIAASHEI